MQFSHSYVSELEELISGILLPTYYRYYQIKGLEVPHKEINSEILAKLTKKDRLPALLKPYEKCT